MNKNDTSTFGSGPDALARLLGMVVGDDDKSQSTGEDKRIEMIQARFAGPLPLDSAVVDALPSLIGKLCEDLLPLGGRALAEILLDKTSSLETLEKIKTYGKQLSKSEEPQHSVGIAVYYAAIASALLFHDAKITKHSYAYLRDSLKVVEDLVPDNMTRHIAKAGKMCRKKA